MSFRLFEIGVYKILLSGVILFVRRCYVYYVIVTAQIFGIERLSAYRTNVFAVRIRLYENTLFAESFRVSP